jgi:putative restriction endonuclease
MAQRQYLERVETESREDKCPMTKNIWTREELLLAFNLYCKLPFGRYHHHNPDVIGLAHIIERTPSAVAMKLSNFASLDPYHQQRGIKGLANASKGDKAIWDEFHNDWNGIALESENLVVQKYMELPEQPVEEIPPKPLPTQPTEAERSVKVRLGQRFFRATILTSFQSRCCICGIPIPDLLIASHIIPWGKREDTRLDPHNGLCLCALHDRAFDKGFLTVTNEYYIQISQRIKTYFPHDALQKHFAFYEGKTISLPDKFIPDKHFLEYHGEEIFIRG